MQRGRLESITTHVVVCGSLPPMGRRHDHSGQLADDLHGRQLQSGELETEELQLRMGANAFEELTVDTNTVSGGLQKFGGSTALIWESGAGRNICARVHVPEYTLTASDHPGFSGPRGRPLRSMDGP